MTRTGIYDPARQLYNWKPSNTRAWRRGVARTWTGSRARINCFGNSTTAGYTWGGRSEWHAWPSYLHRLLAQRYGECGTGTIYFVEPDSRVTIIGGWRDKYGPFGASCWGSTSTSASLTFGPVRAYEFRVTYLTAPGASTISAVSDVPGQWATFAGTSADFGVRTMTVPAGSGGYHTLTVRAGVENGPVFILGVEAVTGMGISVTNVGRGSTVAANLTGGDTWLDSSLKAAIDVNAADLSIVMYAENSPGYQTPESMKTDYRVLLDRIKASGSDLLLVTSIDWEGEGTTSSPMLAPQEEYNAAVYELADEYDVPLWDLASRWGKYEDSPGYYADRIHPSPTGYADIGAGLYSILHTGI